MPGPGPDQRDQRSRNRRPRRRSPIGGGRAPVTEYEEQQELEAARERNDLEVADLREMSVAELRQVSRDLEVDAASADRKDVLVDLILQRQTERAGHDYATGILDIVDEGFGFLRRHGLLPSPDDVYVSSSQVRSFGLRIGDRVSGAVRAPREAEKYWGMLRVDAEQAPVLLLLPRGAHGPGHAVADAEAEAAHLARADVHVVGAGQQAVPAEEAEALVDDVEDAVRVVVAGALGLALEDEVDQHVLAVTAGRVDLEVARDLAQLGDAHLAEVGDLEVVPLARGLEFLLLFVFGDWRASAAKRSAAPGSAVA